MFQGKYKMRWMDRNNEMIYRDGVKMNIDWSWFRVLIKVEQANDNLVLTTYENKTNWKLHEWIIYEVKMSSYEMTRKWTDQAPDISYNDIPDISFRDTLELLLSTQVAHSNSFECYYLSSLHDVNRFLNRSLISLIRRVREAHGISGLGPKKWIRDQLCRRD